MEPIITTGAITIATVVLTEAIKVPGKKLGEVVLEKAGQLVRLIGDRFPNVKVIEPDGQQPLDYGQAYLEIEAAAKADSEIAKAVLEVETAAKTDPLFAQQFQALADAVKSQPPTVQNFTKLAEYIKNVFQGNTIIGGNF